MEPSNKMLIGAPLPTTPTDPAAWIRDLTERHYTAAYWPLTHNAPTDLVESFHSAAIDAEILIAEVGAWSNPIDPDPTRRQAALETCKTALAIADRVGACCCVNIAGSRSATQWDGPDPANLTTETFDMIVESIREIIDAVRPTRSHYTLETMPWIVPTSTDEYLELIRAIDRPAFAVHLDPCNLISSVSDLYSSTALIDECFAKLGPYLRSCHAKDLILEPSPPLRFREVAPGQGCVDLKRIIHHLKRFPEVPFMLEHLESDADYRQAADYLRRLD